MSNYVGVGNDYKIVGENSNSTDLILWPDVVSVASGHRMRAPLCHRLKNSYRHITRKDTRFEERIITFEKVDGMWQFRLTARPLSD